MRTCISTTLPSGDEIRLPRITHQPTPKQTLVLAGVTRPHHHNPTPMPTNNSTWPWTWPITWSNGLPVTNKPHHVAATIDLLSQAADYNLWRTTQPPSIREYWADSQSEKGPGAGQPAICYVWSPTDSSLERFSVDDDELQESNNVQVQIWSLDEQEPVTLQSDVIDILSEYMDDNNTETPYSTVEPINKSDFREQKNARSTDYYITAVEIETEGLTEAGVA